MSRRFLKTMSLVLAAVILLTLAACGQESTKTTKGQESQASAKPAENAAKEVPVLKMVTTWDPGFNINSESPVFVEWGKRTGVKFDVTINPRDNHKEKVNMLLASNEIPDMLKFFQDADSYITYGPKLFASLDDYLNSGKLPNLQQWLKKYPEIERKMRHPQDKKLYGFGIVQDFDWLMSVWYVRNDMLKKEGLDASGIKTLEDFKKACLALKKVKGKDYITSYRLGWDYFASMTGWYFGVSTPSGIGFDANRKNGTGKYAFYPIDSKAEYRTWVETMKWMFDNKLLHPSFLTMKDQELFAGYGDGSFPLQMEQPAMGYSPQASTMNPKNDPGIDIQPIYPFEINGQVFTQPMSPHYNISYRSPMVVNKNSKHAVDAMRAMDYGYSQDGINFFMIGIEGQHFVKDARTPSGFKLDKVQSVWTKGADGKYPEGIKDVREFGFNSWWMLGTVPMYNRFNLLAYKEGEQDKAFAVKNQFDTMIKNKIARDPDPDLNLDKDEITKRAEIENALKTYLSENVSKFIMGAKPMSEYEDFLKGCEKLRYKELVDLLNKKAGITK